VVVQIAGGLGARVELGRSAAAVVGRALDVRLDVVDVGFGLT